MITQLSLNNFKGFKELNNMDFKPITILCGKNSSGKTSILQSILMLKQTIESQNPLQTVLTNGRYAHLGTMENIIFERNFNNSINIELDFLFNRRQLLRSKVPKHLINSLFYGKNSGLERGVKPKDLSYEFKYCVSFRSLDTGEMQKSLHKPIILERLYFKSYAIIKQKRIGGIKFELNLLDETENTYGMVWGSHKNHKQKELEFETGVTQEAKAEVDFANLNIKYWNELDDEDEDEGKTVWDGIVHVLQISDMLRGIFSNFSYIGPIREEPSRRYIFEDEILLIGNKGEYAPYIYVMEADKHIMPHYYIDKKSNRFELSKGRIPLKTAMDDWLSIMGLGNIRPEVINEIIYLYTGSKSKEKLSYNIADVGFGISQIFPILLEGLRMREGDTLILEQPEIHLHPDLQLDMADYFISLALSGKRIILETHSDHFINRIVRRIVEDEEHGLDELVSIYFLSQDSEGIQAEKVQLHEKKGIVNWPAGFFDQAALEQEKIIRSGLKKRNKLRNEKGLNG